MIYTRKRRAATSCRFCAVPRNLSDGTVTASTARALYDIHDLAPDILDDVGNVADGVTMGKQIPAAGAVAVVVEP